MDHSIIHFVKGRRGVYAFHNDLEVPQSLKGREIVKVFKVFWLHLVKSPFWREPFWGASKTKNFSFFFFFPLCQGEHLSRKEKQNCHTTSVITWRLVWDNVKLAFGFYDKRQPSPGDELSVCLIYKCDLIICSTEKLFFLGRQEGCNSDFSHFMETGRA